MEDGLLALTLDAVGPTADRDAKIMEFPGSPGEGRAVCSLSVRMGLKEEFMGEPELSCRLGCVLQHCIISSSEGNHLLQPAETWNERNCCPSAVGEPGEGTCAGTAGARSPGWGHRAGLVCPAGKLPCFSSLLGEKGSTECFRITQRILEHVSCGGLAGGDEGWHVFKAGEGKGTVRCSFLLPSQGDGAV